MFAHRVTHTSSATIQRSTLSTLAIASYHAPSAVLSSDLLLRALREDSWAQHGRGRQAPPSSLDPLRAEAFLRPALADGPREGMGLNGSGATRSTSIPTYFRISIPSPCQRDLARH